MNSEDKNTVDIEAPADKSPDEKSLIEDDTRENQPEIAAKSKRSVSSKKLKAEIEALKAEKNELSDKNLRLLAEFDNFRKRKQSEVMETAAFVKKNLILELLPILDDAERLLDHQDESAGDLTEGAKLIFEKLRKSLIDAGLKPMDSRGKPFDPNLHEAMMTVESSDDDSGVVVEVIQPGYYIGEKVLRHAKVIVSK